ncbi:MAG: hypothetical protein MUP21_00125 [Dehalococcoidia bacterium]|nr:hypothetical protein [Dehalococcoidia bacterium]
MAGVLKRIQFDSIAVTILSAGQIPRILIQWKLEATSQNLSNLKFFVDRGESPTEMHQLNAVPVAAKGLDEYVDHTANVTDLDKIYYFRVRAVEFQGATPVQTFTSPSTTWDGDLDLVGLYIVEEHLFAHRWVYGVPVMVYKKRRDGVYCPECWDDVLQRVAKSNCRTCYGTGRLDGFYAPIEAWMSLEPDPKMEQVVDWGKRQQGQTDIQFTNYPLLSVDDIIVELKPNKFWKVSMVRAPEKNRTVILQLCRLDAVNPSDVEYKIPVPEDRRRVLLEESDLREKEREF